MRFDSKVIMFLFLCLFPLAMKGQTTKDQLKEIRSTVVETQDGNEYYIHTIKRGQTLYMISKAYGVEVNDLIRENPQVKEGIKADQKLRIPLEVKKPVEGRQKPAVTKDKQVQGKNNAAVNKETSVKADTIVKVELPCGIDSSTKKPVYNVALMLPLFLDEVDTLNAENPSPEIYENSKSLQFLPFYEGFRMALDSLEKSGLKIRLYVYDVDKDTVKTRQLLQRPELKTMDLIFGLLYHRNFQIVAAFAEKNRINIVNPISERSELVSGNPFVFKVRPAKKAQYGQLAEYMASAFYRGQVLIVRSGQFPDHDAPEQLRKECHEHKLDVQVVEGQEAAIGLLSKEKENYLVFFSENPEYTLDLTRRLYEISSEYMITVVGLPDWPAMGGLETEYLVTLKTHVISANMIDWDDSSVKKFVRQYQAVFKADPELLAFQGFDVACYFLSALRNYGTNIQRCLGDLKINSLQASFNFIRTKGNGFENQRWTIFRYENYRLIKAN